MRFALLAPTLLAALTLAACLEEAVETQDIVSTVPWPDEERLEYVLFENGDEEIGRGVLSVTRRDDQFELALRFEAGVDRDESVVLVDAVTLKPASVRRERFIEGETAIIEGEYDEVEDVIRTKVITDGDERTIPRRLKEDYYDNESSLFLWRTIPFQEGYEASYHTVLANDGGTQQLITLRVRRKEEVTVPAGTFQTWRLEIRSPDRRQVAWYADTPERPLVQYDNGRQLFQLTAHDGG